MTPTAKKWWASRRRLAQIGIADASLEPIAIALWCQWAYPSHPGRSAPKWNDRLRVEYAKTAFKQAAIVREVVQANPCAHSSTLTTEVAIRLWNHGKLDVHNWYSDLCPSERSAYMVAAQKAIEVASEPCFCKMTYGEIVTTAWTEGRLFRNTYGKFLSGMKN